MVLMISLSRKGVMISMSINHDDTCARKHEVDRSASLNTSFGDDGCTKYLLQISEHNIASGVFCQHILVDIDHLNWRCGFGYLVCAQHILKEHYPTVKLIVIVFKFAPFHLIGRSTESARTVSFCCHHQAMKVGANTALTVYI